MKMRIKILNLTVHDKEYVMLEKDGFVNYNNYLGNIIETLEQNNEIYYILDRNKIFVTKTGMFHLEMELGSELEFY